MRTALARDLLALRPTVLRGNASEVLALLGDSAGGRGVDSTVGTEDARVASVAAADGRLVAAREKMAEHAAAGAAGLERLAGATA